MGEDRRLYTDPSYIDDIKDPKDKAKKYIYHILRICGSIFSIGITLISLVKIYTLWI